MTFVTSCCHQETKERLQSGNVSLHTVIPCLIVPSHILCIPDTQQNRKMYKLSDLIASCTVKEDIWLGLNAKVLAKNLISCLLNYTVLHLYCGLIYTGQGQ